MPSRRRIVAAALALGASFTAGGLALANPDDPKGSLSCVGPLDAAGIDRVLSDAGSPLAGQGTTFVNAAASVGLDPRALVAIAGHETIFMVYGPAARINNPFGIGPGRVYPNPAASIRAAATLLAKNYVGEGRTTLATISAKYAPVGVANDPTNLNANWVGGVGTLYARLGGDPDAPITLNAQPTSCDASTGVTPAITGAPGSPGATPTATPPAEESASDLRVWDGTVPTIASPAMEHGADPFTGEAATVDGFVFPVSGTTTARVRDDFAKPGPTGCYERAIRCAVTVTAARGDAVVAVANGRLATATADEQAAGVAFWLTMRSGDRFGYGQLHTYEGGIMEGATVNAGQPIGTAAGPLVVAWERSGHRINPAPLLRATLT